jgi:hypothetical protein
MPKHSVDDIGLPIDPVLRELELRLCDLASEWRGSDNSVQQEKVAKEYRETMQKLYSLGWDGHLDVECELSYEFMPERYTRQTG